MENIVSKMFEVKDPMHSSRRRQTGVLILILLALQEKIIIIILFASSGWKKILTYNLFEYIYLRKEENIPYA